ncbi:OLC1v1016786C1 [Oldenlandia corymbosa var. corymbosa]|uniref:OLC1v1016786C1 n=1 Tax=Oldenlandia corymbosa var. corymbosa TaxID=529605 RepID=A0AAV1E7Y8_OLDCO|nr:OLC1v1016786C1 [Oldenlandia corymbosa var. corymbosa]
MSFPLPNFVPDDGGTTQPQPIPNTPPERNQTTKEHTPLDNRSTKKPKYGGGENPSPTPMNFRDKIMRGLDYLLFEVEEELDIQEEDVILSENGSTAKVEISDRMEKNVDGPVERHDCSPSDGKINYLTNIIEDMERVLNEGPWVILHTYLHVEVWNNQFDPTTKLVKSTIIWAKLPGLPVHYYNQSFLRRVGRAPGRVVRIDQQTTAKTWGRFPRMAVEIDLDQPLITKVEMHGRKQVVKYENVPPLCASCSRIGHQAGNCPYITPQPPKIADPPYRDESTATSPGLVEENGEAPTNSSRTDGNGADWKKGKEVASALTPSVLGARKSRSRKRLSRGQEWKMMEPLEHIRRHRSNLMEEDQVQGIPVEEDIPPDPHGVQPMTVGELELLEGTDPPDSRCQMEEDSVAKAAVSGNC